MSRIKGAAYQPNLGWRRNGRPGRKNIGIRLTEQLYDALTAAATARGVSRSRFTVEALATAIARHLSEADDVHGR
jgi:uncharacterized protein (DUF1778 family)